MTQTLIMNMVMIFLIQTKQQIYTLQVTSDVDAKDRVIGGLNEYNKSNLNEMRTKNMRQDDGFFNITQNSDHGVDNDVVSIDIVIDSSQMDSMETHMMRMMTDG